MADKKETGNGNVPAAYLDLVRTLSHDVRTPLSTIIGFADIMSNEMMGPLGHTTYREYAEDIRKASRSILETLNDIADTARFKQYASAQSDFRHLIELAPDLICMCRDGVIEMINPAGADMLEVWPAQSLQGRRLVDYLHPDYRFEIASDFSDIALEKSRVPMIFRRASGADIDVEIAAIPYDDDTGASSGAIMVIARDVTERNRAQIAVAQREENLRLVMDAVGDGIAVFNERGTIEMFNAAIEDMFALPSESLKKSSLADLFPDIAGGTVADEISRIRTIGSDMKLEGDRGLSGQRSDGTSFPVEIVINESQFGGNKRYVAAIRDITRRIEYQNRLRVMATRDPLTGLANRNLLGERLRDAIAQIESGSGQLALMYIDLDQFQNINDAFGHEVGDQIIRLSARRVQSCIQDGSTVARVGGDEFHILIPNLGDIADAEDLAKQLLEALSSPYVIDGREIFSSASIGVGVFPQHGDSESSLMRHVDTAANNAKRSGRATYKVYTPRMSEEVHRRVDIGHHLRRALETDELSLNYQAKVSLGSQRIIGAEALLRWHSEELGFVSPAEFIPIAEETGLIVPIGDWVLQTACRQAASWPTHHGLPVQVGVNLSALQFSHGDIVSRVRQSLEQSNLSPERLDLELTESLLVEQPDETIAVLRKLKDMGITISMDDFGTGYSSLSYLTKFPLDALKVDRAFVTDVPQDRDAVVVVRAIVGMAQQLDLQIVAEGIETEGQMQFLHALGCHTGQGYLFSKPLAANDFIKMLEPQAAE